MLKNIIELVNIPSITGSSGDSERPYGEAVNSALEYTLNLCRELGFRVKNCNGQIGYAEIGRGKELIGILCHLDVVPPGNGWTHDPFDAEVVDGKVYGRGTIDDKGPAVAAIYAMSDLLKSRVCLNKRIRIIFGLQEETGDWNDISYYKKHEELPAVGFTPDSKFPAIFCEKGIAQFKICIPASMTGVSSISGGVAVNMVADHACASINTEEGIKTIETSGKSAHGSRPEEGVNAITGLMEILAEKYGDPMAKWYMRSIGHDIHGEHIGCRVTDETGELTLNVGKISMEGEYVMMAIDIRHPGTYSSQDILERLKSSLAPDGIAVELVSVEHPVYIEKTSPVIRALMKAYEDVTQDMTPAQIIGGGTYARAMDDIVAFGPAFPGEERMEHKTDEFADVDKLMQARAIYVKALENLLAI